MFGTPSSIGLPKWPACPGCCLVRRSNLALGHGPELRIPAPLRCEEGKGHPEQCGRKWLHAYENQEAFAASRLGRASGGVERNRSLVVLRDPQSQRSFLAVLETPPRDLSSRPLLASRATAALGYIGPGRMLGSSASATPSSLRAPRDAARLRHCRSTSAGRLGLLPSRLAASLWSRSKSDPAPGPGPGLGSGLR